MASCCTENWTSSVKGSEEINAIKFYDNHISVNKKPLISDSAKEIIEITVHITLIITTSIIGIITNVINITVYSRLGLKDSISLGFFALSISDLFLVIMSLITAFCYVAKVLLPESNIDFTSVHFVSSSSCRNMGYSISGVITSFLSLERCCCVVLPFKVKVIFTRARTATFLVLIFAFHVVCYAPYFASQYLQWTPYTSLNGTVTYRLKIRFSRYRPITANFVYTLFGIFTPTLSQIVVAISAVILINGLRASSKFRQAMNRATATDSKRSQLPAKGSDIKDVAEPDGAGLSRKEARPVKAMLCLVAIMTVSNVPYLMVTYTRIVVSDFNVGKRYQNTFSTSYAVVYTLSSLNASLNILVYYFVSAKYKETFKSLVFFWER